MAGKKMKWIVGTYLYQCVRFNLFHFKYNNWFFFSFVSECFRISSCSWCTSDKKGYLLKGFCGPKEICPSQQCLKDGLSSIFVFFVKD